MKFNIKLRTWIYRHYWASASNIKTGRAPIHIPKNINMVRETLNRYDDRERALVIVKQSQFGENSAMLSPHYKTYRNGVLFTVVLFLLEGYPS